MMKPRSSSLPSSWSDLSRSAATRGAVAPFSRFPLPVVRLLAGNRCKSYLASQAFCSQPSGPTGCQVSACQLFVGNQFMKCANTTRSSLCLLALSLAVAGCANVDQKTQGAGIGAAVGCAAGAVFAKLTKNDATTACVAGAVVGGLVGYQRARNAEIEEARVTTEEAVRISGGKASPVRTETVRVTDKQTGKTDAVRAFKSVSVDIPLSQLNTANGEESMRKLNDYARKMARERAETIQMTIATTPARSSKATPVSAQEMSEKVGEGMVLRRVLTDSTIPPNVQRVNIEANNPARLSV